MPSSFPVPASWRRVVRPDQLADAARVTGAMLATFAVMFGVTRAGGQSDGLIVLGVVVCRISTRNALRRGTASGWRLAARAVALPVLTAMIAAVGTVFADVPPAGDALFVAAAFAALWARRFPPAVAAAARLAQLPLLALFIAPVPPVDRGAHGLPWLLVTSVVATTFTTLAQIAGHKPAPPAVAPSNPQPATAGQRRLAPTTKLALQTAVGLTAAFVIAQNAFSPRWTWTVVSAFTVGAGARSRGDVIIKGAERLGGALAGTLVATLLAEAVGADHPLSVALIFVLLAAGLALRDTTYAAWAFCMTGALALLYGLFGEPSASLLGDRLVQVTVGAACAVGAAAVVFPIPTEAVTRRAISRTLAAVDDLLVASPGDAPPVAWANVEEQRERLREVSRPLRIARRLHLPGGHVVAWVEMTERAVAEGVALARSDPDPQTVRATRKTLGGIRRQMRQPLAPLGSESPQFRGDPPPEGRKGVLIAGQPDDRIETKTDV